MDTSRRHTSQSIMSNPLYASSPTLLCIEGVAACVRGEIDPQSIDSLPGEYPIFSLCTLCIDRAAICLYWP